MKEEGCAFCGRSERNVEFLVEGLNAFICGECSEKVHEIVKRAERKEQRVEDLKLKKPKEIKKFLDQYVIGQDKAKKTLSVAVYNHYKRLKQQNDTDDVEIEKSNVILVGETGTGKTLLARTIAKLLEVPFTIVDATVLTEAGYVGEDIESLLSKLLQAADYDKNLAERGIVYIDELDKIARKTDNPSITRDVSGEGVQQGLLKLLEGAVVNVPPEGGRKHPEQKFVQIDTKNILFIAGGAFDGIERQIAKRMNTQMIGFDKKATEQINKNNLLQYVAPQDLKSFGLIPEIIGRLPVLTFLNPLEKDTLRKILTEPKNALTKQYKKLFDMDSIKLSFTPAALDYIVDKAMEFKLGARGLRSICETVMTDAMFEMPSKKVSELKIDVKFVEKQLKMTEFAKFKKS